MLAFRAATVVSLVARNASELHCQWLSNQSRKIHFLAA
jgi:hypothetical protein